MEAFSLFLKTPQQSNKINLNQQTTNYEYRPRSQGRPHKHKIFGSISFPYSINREIMMSSMTNFNKLHGTFEQQALNENQVAIEDFCGCENNIYPCEIINRYFIRFTSLNDMKRQYQRIQSPVICPTKQFSRIQKTLFDKLPKWYPQIYFTHLNNLLKCFYNSDNKNPILHFNSINQSQFILLSWIEYHCKLEYISYFFYSDLKRQFLSFGKFRDGVDLYLIKYGTTFDKLKREYANTTSSQIWDKFFEDFYISIGASIVPVSQYAKLLALIMKRGCRIVPMLFAFLIGKNRQQFLKILRFIQFRQLQECYHYARTYINWENIFQILQQEN